MFSFCNKYKTRLSLIQRYALKQRQKAAERHAYAQIQGSIKEIKIAYAEVEVWCDILNYINKVNN
jgi:hypothetical protein